MFLLDQSKQYDRQSDRYVENLQKLISYINIQSCTGYGPCISHRAVEFHPDSVHVIVLEPTGVNPESQVTVALSPSCVPKVVINIPLSIYKSPQSALGKKQCKVLKLNF